MCGLLKKDFLLLKAQKNFLILLIFITFFIGWNTDGRFAVSYLTFLSGFLLLGSFSYDDNGSCISFLMTLPVSRSGYVKEKYAFGVLLTTCGWIIGELIDAGMALIRGNALSLADCVFDLGWLFGFWVFISVIIPFVIRYGVERGRLGVFFVVACVVVLGYLGRNLLAGMDVDAGAMIAGLLAQKELLLLYAAIATVVILAVSYGISMGFMKRKEF